MRQLGNIFLFLTTAALVLLGGLQWALGYWIPFMTGLLVLSAVSLVLGLVINARYYMQILKSDAFRFVGKGLGSVLFVSIFLVAANYTLFKNNLFYDWTPNAVNSLSPISIKTLKDLKSDFIFHVFHTSSAEGLAEKDAVLKALEIYRRTSPKVVVQVHNIFQSPELAEDYNVGEATAALFASHGDRRKRLQGLLGERELTSAILQLSREERVVYVTQNHQERRLDGTNTYGLSRFRESLERLFYLVKPLENFPVPEDAALLAIIGPRESFRPDELKGLEDYLNRGGRAIVVLDPGEEQNLSSVLESFGIEFENTFVASSKSQDSQYSVFLEPAEYKHELGQILEGSVRPVFYISSSLKIVGTSYSDVRTLPILNFEKNAKNRKTLSEDAEVVSGETPLAMAMSEGLGETNKGMSLVVAGDSDFLTNQFVQMEGNFTLAMGTLNFLSRDKDIQGVEPRKARTTYLLIPQTQLNFYVLFFILPFPFLFFLMALFFRMRRAF